MSQQLFWTVTNDQFATMVVAKQRTLASALVYSGMNASNKSTGSGALAVA
jgi:hypothetical protein